MHDLRIMHRDLKSANVFLNQDGTAKLGDMNVSKLLDQQGLNYTQTGTPYYASPEVWKDEPYGIKSDIWSMGCVLYEMVALKPPFRASDMQGLYKKVTKGIYPKIPKVFSPELGQVIKMMLSVKPDTRPTCMEILTMDQSKEKIAEYFLDDPNVDESELLKTIMFPKSFMSLTQKLPKPSYPSAEGEEGVLDSKERYEQKDHLKSLSVKAGAKSQKKPTKTGGRYVNQSNESSAERPEIQDILNSIRSKNSAQLVKNLDQAYSKKGKKVALPSVKGRQVSYSPSSSQGRQNNKRMKAIDSQSQVHSVDLEHKASSFKMS